MHIPLDRCTYNHRCQSSSGEPRFWCYSHRLLSFQKHQVRNQYRWYASHFPFAPPNLSRCFLLSNGGRNVVLSRKINTCHLIIKFSVRLGSCHARFLPPSAATVGPQTVPGTITFVANSKNKKRLWSIQDFVTGRVPSTPPTHPYAPFLLCRQHAGVHHLIPTEFTTSPITPLNPPRPFMPHRLDVWFFLVRIFETPHHYLTENCIPVSHLLSLKR